jgi:hypothetical protein
VPRRSVAPAAAAVLVAPAVSGSRGGRGSHGGRVAQAGGRSSISRENWCLNA